VPCQDARGLSLGGRLPARSCCRLTWELLGAAGKHPAALRKHLQDLFLLPASGKGKAGENQGVRLRSRPLDGLFPCCWKSFKTHPQMTKMAKICVPDDYLNCTQRLLRSWSHPSPCAESGGSVPVSQEIQQPRLSVRHVDGGFPHLTRMSLCVVPPRMFCLPLAIPAPCTARSDATRKAVLSQGSCAAISGWLGVPSCSSASFTASPALLPVSFRTREMVWTWN